MYRKQDSLEQGLVTPPPPSALASTTPRRKIFSNNFRPELDHRHLYPTPSYVHRNRSPLRFSSVHSGDGCLSRTPFASLSAFLCCMFGVFLFATMMAWAFTASVEQARRALHVQNLPWLDKVHLLFLVSACAMLAVSLAFLLIGLLSTGPTRHAVFSGGGGGGRRQQSAAAETGGNDHDTALSARRGGRISCVIAICLSFVLNLLWTTIALLTAVLCFIYTILFLLCSSANDCLNFGGFEPLFNEQNNSLKFCGGELQQFCAVTNTVIVWYFVGLLGAVIVCIGLVQFIASNAANYAHIGSEAKYAELRHLFYSEINNNNNTGCTSSSGVVMPLEQFNNSVEERRCSNGYGADRPHHYPHQPYHYQQHSLRQHHSLANTAGGKRNKWETEKADGGESVRHARNAVHPPPSEYRPSQIEKRVERRSVGTTLGSVRRNSYQNSLHGSNNWLNYADGF